MSKKFFSKKDKRPIVEPPPPKVDVQPLVIVEPPAKKKSNIPPLALGEKYFEHPDGRILVGPAKADAIIDRVTGNRVNPKT